MTKVDQNVFDAVKTLLKGGATWAEVAKYLSVSIATVQRIKNAETLQEYRNQMTAVSLSYREKNKANPPPAEPTRAEKYYCDNRIIEELKAQNELLKLISNKLAFIVEQLS